MNVKTSEISARDNYRLLSGGITPRPIAWISTRSKEGINNLAPYSFFTVASCNPPVLLYTQVTPQNGMDKNTLENLAETGECVVNIVNTHLLEKMNTTSASLDKNQSEFQCADVEETPSQCVTPLSVKDSPIRYECTLRETIKLGELPAGGTIVLLDVKSIYIQDELYSGGVINQALIDSVGKMGGDVFAIDAKHVAFSRP